MLLRPKPWQFDQFRTCPNVRFAAWGQFPRSTQTSIWQRPLLEPSSGHPGLLTLRSSGTGRVTGAIMKSLLVAAAVVTALCLGGCVSTSATMLAGGAAMPATDPASVTIYRTASQVPGAYREMALLDSVGDSMGTNPTQMYNSMRQRAAAIGANGVIIDAVSEPSAGAQVASLIFRVGGAQRRGRSIAIIVESQPLVPAPPRR